LQAGPSQWPRLQLAPAGQGSNAALVVDFKVQGDKTINTVLLGKKHLKKSGQASPMGEGDEGWPDGRYVLVGTNSENVAVLSDPRENFEPKPEQWLDHDFFRVEKARSIEVAFPAASNSWKLTRETEAGDWKLSGAKANEPLDPSKVMGVSNPFNSAS